MFNATEMFSTIRHIIKKINPAVIITVVLFILPFFWLGTGQMDLGGDDNRLFFYDPVSYLKNSVIYDVIIEGKGRIEPHYYYLPYVGLLAILKILVSSPTMLINIVNGIKLAGGFLFIYLIVREFLQKSSATTSRKLINVSAILAGIFYIGAFGSFNMVQSWDRALTSHNQIFLNPIIFYLLLKFFLTHTYRYLWIALLVSFVFAPNFGLTSAPAFFAFYPLAFLFLFTYIKVFVKQRILWKGILVGIALFIGLQAFHLLGQVVSLLDNNSFIGSRVFNKELIEKGGVNYFMAVSGLGKASLNFLLPSSKPFLQWMGFIAPLTVVTGLLFNSKRKEFLLIAVFFMLTFFLAAANISEVGLQLYKNLFYIPGFSMFRNFYIQWQFIFIFFYSLLFGFAVYAIAEKLKQYYLKLFVVFVFVILTIISYQAISGDLVNKSIIRGSDNVKSSFVMDPQYEKTLKFVRSLPDDGKILVLPLTDYYLQVIPGNNDGAYEGPSTLRSLTTKYSFVGYQHFGYIGHLPYAEDVLKYSREKNYDRLLRIFTVLNIRYIIHNTDPMAYEKGFSPGPFGYMQTSMPKTQEEYKEFLSHFPIKSIYKNGSYVIYEIDSFVYNPTIFIPDGFYKSSQLSFDQDKIHTVFIDENICNSKEELKGICAGGYRKSNADISFEMINPALYAVTVRAHEKIDSLLLVMQHTFHNGWEVVSDEKYIAEDLHFPVNGYANGWFLTKKDLPDKENYTLFIKLDPQKYFWYGLLISSVSLLALLGLLSFSIIKKHGKN